jgi:hypothetical protein
MERRSTGHCTDGGSDDGGDPALREPFYEIVALIVAAGAPVESVMAG